MASVKNNKVPNIPEDMKDVSVILPAVVKSLAHIGWKSLYDDPYPIDESDKSMWPKSLKMVLIYSLFPVIYVYPLALGSSVLDYFIMIMATAFTLYLLWREVVKESKKYRKCRMLFFISLICLTIATLVITNEWVKLACLITSILTSIFLAYKLTHKHKFLFFSQKISYRKSIFTVIPLVLPISLLLLFVPLVTAELWAVVENIKPLIFCILLIIISLPIAFVLYVESINSLEKVINDIAKDQSEKGDNFLVESFSKQFHKAKGTDKKYKDKFLSENKTKLPGIITANKWDNLSPYASFMISSRMKKSLFLGLIVVVISFWITTFIFISLLSLLMLDYDIIASWSQAKEPISYALFFNTKIPLLLFKMSALLSTLSVAILCAFALTDSHYRNKVTYSLIKGPTLRVLPLALTYFILKEGETHNDHK